MKKAILIIDDSWIARLKLTKYLTDGGYSVLEVDSGESALTLLDTSEPNLILLDLLMPGLSGFDILSTLQNSEKTIPVIIMSADIQHTTRDKCLELGAQLVLPKPPDRTILLSEVDRILHEQ